MCIFPKLIFFWKFNLRFFKFWTKKLIQVPLYNVNNLFFCVLFCYWIHLNQACPLGNLRGPQSLATGHILIIFLGWKYIQWQPKNPKIFLIGGNFFRPIGRIFWMNCVREDGHMPHSAFEYTNHFKR